MRKLVLIFSFLVHTSSGLRVEPSTERAQLHQHNWRIELTSAERVGSSSSSAAGREFGDQLGLEGTLKTSKVLTLLLLALNPSEAFARSGARVRFPTFASHTLPARHQVSMRAAHEAPDLTMHATYDELSDRLLEQYDTNKASLKNNQLFVGIGGGPGSGKSTLAAALADRVNGKRPDAAVVLPMDGFHFSRAELRTMGELGKVIGDPESTMGDFTSFTDLIARRGAPWTFDAAAIVREFSRIREDGFGSLPVYSRQKSDPVPDGVELKASHQIVLLEGNYLLCHSDPEWAPLNNIFDEKWYISCSSMEAQRERLTLRHLETWTEEKTEMWGPGKEGAAAKADANDVKNAQWIDEMSRGHADLVIESK